MSSMKTQRDSHVPKSGAFDPLLPVLLERQPLGRRHVPRRVEDDGSCILLDEVVKLFRTQERDGSG